MSNRNNQIVETLLSVLSKELGMSMDDLRMRCDVDEVALEVDRYIAEHPEKFGMVPTSNEEIDLDSFTDSVNRFGDAPPVSPLDPILVPVPEPEKLSFLIELDAIFPFSDDEVSLYFDEYDGQLSIGTVILAKDEQYEARADAVENFVRRSPLSKIVFLDDEGGHLYLSNHCNCDINDLDEIKETFTHWLDILRNDQSFIETMNDILNM